MPSVLGPVQPAHPSPFRTLHNASHPWIPYPQLKPQSVPSWLPIYRFPRAATILVWLQMNSFKIE
ncbi:hypothetical protein SCLCIDRAFT_34161 [Scleroderma citrinum Foug A]|uniref:Uncharacterized protein n=1 Tax=Scleroderma citrinum Foug A TaxID=1036808 RepID=A0A0C3D2E6_9AGAM|nr:hypothetical protein SCLCIDRAFT_34161 [Scleroderma citrinum Foug A]